MRRLKSAKKAAASSVIASVLAGKKMAADIRLQTLRRLSSGSQGDEGCHAEDEEMTIGCEVHDEDVAGAQHRHLLACLEQTTVCYMANNSIAFTMYRRKL